MRLEPFCKFTMRYTQAREDGVWTPNLPNFISTSEGMEILVAIQGAIAR